MLIPPVQSPACLKDRRDWLADRENRAGTSSNGSISSVDPGEDPGSQQSRGTLRDKSTNCPVMYTKNREILWEWNLITVSPFRSDSENILDLAGIFHADFEYSDPIRANILIEIIGVPRS